MKEGHGTNPEELIAAAHAGCFSMALAAQVELAGFNANHIKTVASVSLKKSDEGFFITSIHLEVSAKIPHLELTEFNKIANNARVC